MSDEIITRAEARSKSLTLYFTGEPCKHGHVSPRRTKGGECVACRSLIEKKSYYKHQSKRIAKTMRWRDGNREKFEEYRSTEAYRESVRRGTRKWSRSNRAKIKAYRRKITADGPNFRLRINLANRINCAVRYVWGSKSARTLELIGCTIEELRAHLERQFVPGMTWDNYGYGDDKWHIDHIVPCAMFDLNNPEQQKKCFHYKNLQPLWQPDNFRKNKRLECL